MDPIVIFSIAQIRTTGIYFLGAGKQSPKKATLAHFFLLQNKTKECFVTYTGTISYSSSAFTYCISFPCMQIPPFQLDSVPLCTMAGMPPPSTYWLLLHHWFVQSYKASYAPKGNSPVLGDVNNKSYRGKERWPWEKSERTGQKCLKHF